MPAHTPSPELSPRMQLWVTAVALVVGFLCGLAIAFMVFRPSLSNLSATRQAEAIDHRALAAIAKSDPAAFKRALEGLPPADAEHVRAAAGQ